MEIGPICVVFTGQRIVPDAAAIQLAAFGRIHCFDEFFGRTCLLPRGHKGPHRQAFVEWTTESRRVQSVEGNYPK